MFWLWESYSKAGSCADLPGLLVIGDVVALADQLGASLVKEDRLATA